METSDWQPVINNILFRVQFEGALDATVVDSIANQIVDRPFAEDTVAGNLASIVAAIQSRDRLSAVIETPHSETGIRDFLGRLADRLQELRPWPTPPYLPIPLDQAGDFGKMRSVGTIHLHQLTVQNSLQTLFDPAFFMGSEREIAALRLRTGDVICLVAPTDFREPGVVVITPSSQPAAHIMAAVAELTNLADTDLETHRPVV